MNIKHTPVVTLILLCILSCGQQKKNPQPPAAAPAITERTADQINYYLLFDSVMVITPDTLNAAKAQPYNGELVIAPGIYNIGGETLNMEQEGLYRVLIPFKRNYQVIVFKNDALKLLSSVSWIITHGSTDDNMSDDSLIQKAKDDKVYITCERTCQFTKNFLSKYNIQSRLIQGRAIDKPNGYDEGHVMLEVLLPDTKKWMLFDVDNNSIFKTTNGTEYLNLMEFKDALDSNDLQILHLSLDKRVDISQFKDGDYSFSFYSESITASRKTLKKWYERILGVVLIDNHYYNPAGEQTLKNYSNSCVYLDKEAFRKKFYQ